MKTPAAPKAPRWFSYSVSIAHFCYTTEMKTFIVLLRGINVGGKNKVPMQQLKQCLQALGYDDVTTYIASGNVILKSNDSATTISESIEKMLPKKFKLNSSLIKVLVLTKQQLQKVIATKPKGFGEQPKKYHSDVIFLMGISTKKALTVFDPKAGIDTIWPGKGVIYSQRLSSERTKSTLSKIVGTPAYKEMTIRNWNTVTRLVELAREEE